MLLTKSLLFCAVSICAAFASEEDVWYPYQFNSGYGNREELTVTKVDAVDYFKTTENVLNWKSLTLKNKSYALGLTEDGVTVLEAVMDDKNDSFVTNATYTPLNRTVIDATLFEYWNKKLAINEIVAIVATMNNTERNKSVDLHWFKITSNNKLMHFWEWNMKKKITHLNLFKIENKYNLLLSNERYVNYSTADLYEFSLQPKPDFWLVQTIILDVPTNSSAINSFEFNTYLSIPQESKVCMFVYDGNHFVPHKNYSVDHVRYVTSFQIGFQSYLALDGFNAGIFKFTKDGLAKQEIPEANLEGINFWLAIPISTYRDEQILIAERSIDYASHRSHVIEIIMYNGGRFAVHDEMLCDYYGDITNGMNCLIEEEQTEGIKGSAFLINGNVVGILIPRKNAPSGLFMMYTELKQLESPVSKEIKSMNAWRKKLEAKIKNQNNQLDKIQKSLEKSVKLDTENIISAPWKIDTLSAAAMQTKNELVAETPVKINVDKLIERANKVQNLINEINLKLENNLSKELGNKFKTLIVNGLVQIESSSNIKSIETNQFHDVNVKDQFEDFVRVTPDKNKKITSIKSFMDLSVESLEMQTINGISAEQIAFKDSDVTIEGSLIFTKPALIENNIETERVNVMDLEQELIHVGKRYDDFLQFNTLDARNSLKVNTSNKFPIHQNSLNFGNEDDNQDESIAYETIYIPGNITVDNLNGEDLDEFISSLCLTNAITYVPNKTTILGNIIINDEAAISNLNNLSFPQDYVFASSNKFSQITGYKYFTNDVYVNELITNGEINGVDPNSVVSLSENQTILGNFIFRNLQVTEVFTVDGEITGEHMKDFLPNPTLLETTDVLSDVNCKILEVDGTITIGDSIYETNLFNILQDIIYKDDGRAEITSIKEFLEGLTVRENLDLTSNTINNIPLDSIISKETSQILTTKILNGAVTIENLHFAGTFGNINLTKLEQETVKLSGEQFISSKLIFEDEVYVEDLEIANDLNDLHYSDYIFNNDDRNMNSANFEHIKAANLEIRGNLLTKTDNFNLDEFDSRRLSYSKTQTIPANFNIAKSKIQNLNSKFINGYVFSDLFDAQKYSDKVYELLYQGKLKVKDLVIEDSLNISSINNIPINDVLRNLISTNGDNRKLEIIFKNNVYFKELLVESLNDIDFDDVFYNVVFKNETDVEIAAPKIYVNGCEVRNYIESPQLNEIPVENILRKNGEQIISSPISIEGDVLLNGQIEIEGKINDIPIEYISETFEVLDGDTYKINGDVMFNKVAYIDRMIIMENANEQNVSETLQDLIPMQADEVNIKTATFKNPVVIENNLVVDENINGVDLSNFLENVVTLTQDVVIESIVTFKEDVTIQEEIVIDGELISVLVMGINLQAFIDNAVYINQGMIPGTISFEEVSIESSIKTSFLNNIDMALLIPLRTDETIDGKLEIIELTSFHDIIVNNLVNGYKLEPEYLNTAMSNRIQQINSVVVFEGNILVRRLLDILAPINGNYLEKIVLLSTPQNLTAQYEFQEKITVENNVGIIGLVNGVNMTDWFNKSIKISDPNIQTVLNPWTVDKNFTFKNNVIGNGNIKGLDITGMVDQVEERRMFKYSIEHELLDQFRMVCKDLNGIITASNKQIYLFKYLDEHQQMDFSHPIEDVHQFEFEGKNYILVSDENSCSTMLFIWSENMFKPVRQIETGRVAQIVTVHDGNSLYLVMRNGAQSSCTIEGTNVWKVDGDNIMLLYKIEDQIILQDSLLQGTFYGLSNEFVMEYRLETTTDTNVRKIRKWIVPTENAAFVPRGLKTGISIRNGENLFYLDNSDPIVEEVYESDVDSLIRGNVTAQKNNILPGRLDGDMLLMNVGYPRKKTLVAVAPHEEVSYQGTLDFIKIYEDVFTGTIFHKVPSYKPSSLISLEFGENGETLLIFFEDQKKLQIYTYKGIEGFKQHSTANIEGSKLIPLLLPVGQYNKERNFIALVDKNRLHIIQVVMDGDQINFDNVECDL